MLPFPVKIYPFKIFTRATPGSSLVDYNYDRIVEQNSQLLSPHPKEKPEKHKDRGSKSSDGNYFATGNYLMSGGGSAFLLKGVPAVLVVCNIMRCVAIFILDGFVCSSGEKSRDDLHLASP